MNQPQSPPMERPAREESLPAIKRLFDAFDPNHDGLIDLDDMMTVMKRLKMFPTPTVIRGIIAEVDSKQDGVLDFDEFTEMRRNGAATEMNVFAEFQRFDCDELHRGHLTRDSILRVLRAEGYATEEASLFCARLMAADTDNDGKISYRDLHSLLTRRVPAEWAQWVADNIKRGVSDNSLLPILEQNGFERDRAIKLIQDTHASGGKPVTGKSFADHSLLYIYTLRA